MADGFHNRVILRTWTGAIVFLHRVGKDNDAETRLQHHPVISSVLGDSLPLRIDSVPSIRDGWLLSASDTA